MRNRTGPWWRRPRIRLGDEPESWFGPGMMAVHVRHATSWDELDPVEPLNTFGPANDNGDVFRTVSVPHLGKAKDEVLP